MTRSGVSTIERNQTFIRSFQEHAKTSLLINPEATIQWYHIKSLLPISVGLISLNTTDEIPSSTTVGVLSHPSLIRLPTHEHFRSHPRITSHVIPTTGSKSKNWAPEKWARTRIGPTRMTSGKQQWQRKHFDLR
jgi:hypothetical protein